MCDMQLLCHAEYDYFIDRTPCRDRCRAVIFLDSHDSRADCFMVVLVVAAVARAWLFSIMLFCKRDLASVGSGLRLVLVPCIT